MPDEEKSGSGIGSLIPQVFYDLIARLIPGAVNVVVLALSVYGPAGFWSLVEAWLSRPSDKHPPTTLIIIPGFMVSYALSIALLGLWDTGARLLNKASRGRRDREGSLYGDDEFSRKYDFIKLNNAAAGNRITKLHAEIHMAEALALGFILCSGINLSILLRQLDIARLYLGLSLLVVIVSCIGARRLFIRGRRRAVENYAELLGYVSKATSARPVDTGASSPP